MLRLMLPKNHEMRKQIVKVCAKLFQIYNGDHIIHGNYKNSNQRKDVIISPCMDNIMSNEKNFIYSAEISTNDDLDVLLPLMNQHEN